MYFNFKIRHHIPGRLRLYVPALQQVDDHESIAELFGSIKGIRHVRIEPMIGAMVIDYEPDTISSKQLLRSVGVFFQRNAADPGFLADKPGHVKKDLLKSFTTGVLLLIAFIRKAKNPVPDLFDYLVVISTSYTVLTHGENKLNHPDVLTGIISMASLGSKKILQVSLLTWVVNLVEVINEIRTGRAAPNFNY